MSSNDHAAALSRQLKAWAQEAGFHRVGVARLGPSEYADAYRSWIQRGDHAAMHYLERRCDERFDPRLLLRGEARSALCVALHYFPQQGQQTEGASNDARTSDSQRRSPNELWEGVARYAQGEDYHRVMERRLWQVVERLRAAAPEAKAHVYVDTGPLLERELAQRAGLGVIAKNTMLLDRSGSWFLLGEIVVSLELEPDAPLDVDLCRTCTRCLDACPTRAFPSAYRLDASRCISYWTIEHGADAGETPPELAEQFDGWVFGCDVCQEVCPWNHRLSLVDEAAFRLPPERAELDLVDLADISRQDYVERFRHSAMKRPKREGLQRNARIALANRRRVEERE